jgi:hypothetical protein
VAARRSLSHDKHCSHDYVRHGTTTLFAALDTDRLVNAIEELAEVDGAMTTVTLQCSF